LKIKQDYKVRLKVGDAEVEVQGAESGVVKIVEALSEVLRGARRPIAAPAAGSPQPATAPSARTGPTDIRSFFSEKHPSSDIEAAATAAYYYQYLAPESDRRAVIDSASLQEAFRLAKRPLPSKTYFTLMNARNAGYLDSVGEGGQFRLNPVGYNLVEHTLGPSQESKKQKPIKRHRLAAKK
jgi:hypothetical protein